MAVIECEGRIVQSDATFKLRDTVRQQGDARIIVIDLSDVESLGSSGLGMLLFLERWTSERSIQFKVVDPPDRTRACAALGPAKEQTVRRNPSMGI